MPQNYYLYGTNERIKRELIEEWLKRFEMQNGILCDETSQVDLKGKNYLCRMDQSELKRKKHGGYSHRYIALYSMFDEINFSKRNFKKELDELYWRNPNITVIVLGRERSGKYPKWFSENLRKYSFLEMEIESDWKNSLSYMPVEHTIPESEMNTIRMRMKLID